MSLLSQWRTDGFDASQVEVWAVGYANTAALVPGFAAGGEGACFADAPSPGPTAYSLFGATQDDLFVVDQAGQVQHHVSTLSMNLALPANATLLDGWVRALLP